MFCVRGGGIVKVNVHDGTTKQVDVNSTGWDKLNATLISKIIELRDGRIAILGFANLTIYDYERQTTISIPVNGSSRSLMQSRDGTIWAGAFNGLIRISEQGRVLKRYTLGAYNGETRQFVQSIVEDRDGIIWFGSGTLGLGRLDPRTDSLIQFLPDDQHSNDHILTSEIADMIYDGEQYLWMGTDIGLIRQDIETNERKYFNRNDGLISDRISGLVMDDNQILWMSGQGGISSLDLKTDLIRVYDPSDGLLNISYRERSRFYHDGVVYFGGTRGVDFFDPTRLRKPLSSLEPRILNVKVDGENHTINNPRDIEELRLGHAHDLLEIEFGATNFGYSEPATYAYRMPELVDDWIDLGSKRQVLFSDLPSGDHRLEVRAKYPNGSWSDRILKMEISVSTPYWQTWWFRLLCILLAFLLIYQLIRNRERRSKQKAEREAAIQAEILKLEKKALLAQMNPHFMFNSMNAIQHFMVEKNHEKAMTYLSKFGRLLRSILNISEDNEVLLSQEMDVISHYLDLEKFRYPDRLDYDIDVSPELSTYDVKIPSFLIQPHVEYAVQNSLQSNEKTGLVKIRAEMNGQHVQVVIDDNGTVESDSEHSTNQYQNNTLHSISIVEKRLKYINQNFSSRQIQTQKIMNDMDEVIGNRIILKIDFTAN